MLMAVLDHIICSDASACSGRAAVGEQGQLAARDGFGAGGQCGGGAGRGISLVVSASVSFLESCQIMFIPSIMCISQQNRCTQSLHVRLV
jgi:hypothetical protein